MSIIREKEPISRERSWKRILRSYFLGGIIAPALFYLLKSISGGVEVGIVFGFSIFMVLFILAINISSTYFSGWKLHKDSIELLDKPLFKKDRNQKIMFTEIKKIRYSERPRTIKFYLNQKQVDLCPSLEKPEEVASLLKFFEEKDLIITFSSERSRTIMDYHGKDYL
ncbi:MAG: hypothetical protein AAF740_03405 [Bacteroidota bacterium]